MGSIKFKSIFIINVGQYLNHDLRCIKYNFYFKIKTLLKKNFIISWKKYLFLLETILRLV